MRERCMALRLRDDAVPRVDEQHRQLRGARRRDHVARVLLVSRRVGDDELAPRHREVAIRDVDRMPCSRSATRPSVSNDRSRSRRCRDVRSTPPAGRQGLPSSRSRPINVLLPSSTLPAVRNRSTPWSIRSMRSIAPIRSTRALAQFHRCVVRLVVEPRRTTLGDRRRGRFGDDRVNGARQRCYGAVHVMSPTV